MKMTLLLILLTISIPAFSPEDRAIILSPGERICPFERIWEAVKIIESGNNPDTINYSELAFGCGQIRQDKLNDFNRANKTTYTLNDCLSESVSREIFFWHCRGYENIDKSILRWNGSGASAQRYLKKVQNILNKI